MKVRAFAVPYLSWLDIQEAIMLGLLPTAEFADRKEQSVAQSIRHSWVSDLRVVYAESVSAFIVHAESSSEEEVNSTTYFVGISEANAAAYALEVLFKLPSTPLTAAKLLQSKPKYKLQLRPLSNPYAEVYKKHAETKSYVHALQPLMYKIKDKEVRKETEKSVHAFLGGLQKKPPITGVERIDSLMKSPLTSEFRAICIAAAGSKTAVEDACGESGFNPFEVIFVLKRCNLGYRTSL